MVTVTLDEITLNAVKAALDLRVDHLESVCKLWQGVIDQTPPNYLPTEDCQRALIWNIAALHETKLAREILTDPEPLVDHPEDEAWTNREGMPEFNGAYR